MVEADTLPGLVQIGETLRAARESRGISLDQAATRLRCDLRVIEALEAGRFDDLGPTVFARGHLLRYAALLGEPGEAMVEEWSQLAAAGTGAELMRGLHGPRGRDLRQVRRRLVIAAALLSGISIAVWALQNLPGRGGRATPTAVAATPAPTLRAAVSTPPVAPRTDPTLAAAAPAVGPGAAGSPIAQPAAPPPPATPPVPEPAAKEPTRVATAPATPPVMAAEGRGVVRLRMAFAADSWLEIYDVRNRRLFFGLATVGAPVDVQGRAPLRVIVGNAPAATVELNGRRVDVPPDAMRGRRAAALRVNADGRLLALPRA